MNCMILIKNKCVTGRGRDRIRHWEGLNGLQTGNLAQGKSELIRVSQVGPKWSRLYTPSSFSWHMWPDLRLISSPARQTQKALTLQTVGYLHFRYSAGDKSLLEGEFRQHSFVSNTDATHTNGFLLNSFY